MHSFFERPTNIRRALHLKRRQQKNSIVENQSQIHNRKPKNVIKTRSVINAARNINDDNAEVEDNDSEYPPPSKKMKIEPKKKSFKLKNASIICDRYNMSDRAAAAIISATLQDVELITETDRSKVIDRNKLRRSRKAERNVSLKYDIEEIVGLYILNFWPEGQKSYKNNKRYGVSRNITKYEEHISIISEPGSQFVGHISPLIGKASDKQKCILRFCGTTKFPQVKY